MKIASKSFHTTLTRKSFRDFVYSYIKLRYYSTSPFINQTENQQSRNYSKRKAIKTLHNGKSTCIDENTKYLIFSDITLWTFFPDLFSPPDENADRLSGTSVSYRTLLTQNHWQKPYKRKPRIEKLPKKGTKRKQLFIEYEDWKDFTFAKLNF